MNKLHFTSSTLLSVTTLCGVVACGGPSAPINDTNTTGTASSTAAPTVPPATVAPTPPAAPVALVTLPPAPVEANVAAPAGAAGGLTVLNWAGFTAAASYTFDDTNSSQIENYAALNGLGVHFTFYLITGKSEIKDAVWKQALLDGHEIGNHTDSHNEDDDGTDVDAATTFIQTEFGITPYTMAAPYGKSVYADLAETRYFINRGVNGGSMGAGDNTNPFNIYCFIPSEAAPAKDFTDEIDAAIAAKKWHVALVHGFTGGSDSAYQPVDINEFVTAVQYAKDQKSVWLDSVVNVGAYWLGQKSFNAATVAASGADQVWTWTLPEHFPPGHVLRVTVTGGKLSQNGTPLVWDSHGYYEVSLDAKSLTLSP